MADVKALARLLRLLVLKEEQAQRELETALARLHELESRLAHALRRERSGRDLVRKSAAAGDPLDRFAGVEETLAAERFRAVLRPRLAEARELAAELREEYLLKRVERRQAETLLEEANTRLAEEASRRTQQSLDELHLDRMRRQASSENSPSSNSARP
jgi:flagellar export protein FliJ